MNINLIAVGTRMPNWVEIAYNEYAKRLPPECSLKLIEVPAEKRGKNVNIPDLIQREGKALLNHCLAAHHVIALDVKGKNWDTPALADELKQWLAGGRHINLLIGGPDGLSAECLSRAKTHWSLSPLTLPHPLVRIIVAEQLYRAWSIIKGHPYHR